MAHNDEAGYPYFEASGSTGKADLLAELKRVAGQAPGYYNLARRIVNTDLALLTDASTTTFDDVP